MLIAIDPGKARSACALFDDGYDLVKVFWSTDVDAMGVIVDTVAIEKPRCYPHTATPPNDLIDLAWEGALIARSFDAEIKAFAPSEWKGQIDKPQHHMRIWKKLGVYEHQTFAEIDPSYTPDWIEAYIRRGCLAVAKTGKVTGYSAAIHNFLDAVGIGLFALGRTRKGGV